MRLFNLIEKAEEKDSPEHRKEISEGKLLELLKEKARNTHAIAKVAPFFRQDKGPDFQLVTPAVKEERSSFWVDKLIREIPAWSKFPSRARFIKAYTKYDRTHGGDDVYVLIPLDGARIGISPGPSFYRSFQDLEKSIGFDRVDNKAFCDWITLIEEGLAQITDTKIKKTDPKTFRQFQKALMQIDEVLKSDRELLKHNLSSGDKLSDEQAKVIKDLLSRHITNAEQYLAEKLDPEVNGFQTMKMESFSKTTGDHEIWVDSPCLLIKRSAYVEMHKRGAFE